MIHMMNITLAVINDGSGVAWAYTQYQERMTQAPGSIKQLKSR